MSHPRMKVCSSKRADCHESDNPMPDVTINERLATIEADVRFIKDHILTEHKEVVKRVNRLEQLGAAVTAIFTAVSFYFSNLKQ
jgi:hypothetical protein